MIADDNPRDWAQERAEAQWDHDRAMQCMQEAFCMPLPLIPFSNGTASEVRAKADAYRASVSDLTWRSFPCRRTQGQWNRLASWCLGRLFLTWQVPRTGNVNDIIRSLRLAGRQ